MSNIISPSKFSGQLGNHLFQANLLLQVSNLLSSGVHFRSNLISEHFVFKRNIDFISLARSKCLANYSVPQIEDLGFDLWVEAVRNDFANRKLVTIGPGVAGKIFFESCVSPPSSFFRFVSGSPKKEEYPDIAIHFRAGDFQVWNPKAVLPESYYMNSLDYLESLGSNVKNSYFATDDPFHPTSLKIAQRIGKSPKVKTSVSSDFEYLSHSKFLISSPSTFAFWAAVLGNDVGVIHSKDWLIENEALGVKFWVDVRKNDSNFYKVIAEI